MSLNHFLFKILLYPALHVLVRKLAFLPPQLSTNNNNVQKFSEASFRTMGFIIKIIIKRRLISHRNIITIVIINHMCLLNNRENKSRLTAFKMRARNTYA